MDRATLLTSSLRRGTSDGLFAGVLMLGNVTTGTPVKALLSSSWWRDGLGAMLRGCRWVGAGRKELGQRDE